MLYVFENCTILAHFDCDGIIWDNSLLVYGQSWDTIFRRPIYPMLMPWNSNSNIPNLGLWLVESNEDLSLSLFLFFPLSGVRCCLQLFFLIALKIVMNIDNCVFRMPIYPMLSFRRPIYPMLKQWNSNSNNGIPTQISLILASGWSRAMNIVMNIDESLFRMPIYPMLSITNKHRRFYHFF